MEGGQLGAATFSLTFWTACRILVGMKPILILLLSFSLLAVCSCEDIGYVEKAKYDKLAQENADLKKQLAQKEDEIKKTPHHHYSLHREGLRTFRFDADTGSTCIQLTSQDDWKKSDIKKQSCDCQDYIETTPMTATDEIRKMYCGW
jgi:hypothetical protein